MGKNGVCVGGIGDSVSVGFGAKGEQDANAMTKTKGIMNLLIIFMLSIKFCVVLETGAQPLIQRNTSTNSLGVSTDGLRPYNPPVGASQY